MRVNGKINYNYLVGWILSLSLYLLFIYSLQFDVILSRQVMLHLTIWFFIYMTFQYPKLLACLALPLLIILFLIFIGSGTVYKFYNFFTWSYEYIMGLTSIIPDNHNLYLGVLMAILSNVVISTMLKGKKLRGMIPFFIIFFIVQWFRFIDEALYCLNLFMLGLGLLYILEVNNNSPYKFNDNPKFNFLNL